LTKTESGRFRSLLFFSGVLLGASVMCRYSTALYGIPLTALVLWRKELRKGFWYFLAGVGIMALFQGMLDFITWGRFFGSSVEFFVFNIVEERSLAWGYKPLMYYYEMLPIIFGHAYPLPLLALERRDWKSVFFASAIALFLCVMSFIPHKELRFLLTIIPLICILSAQAVLDRHRSRPERALLFLLVGLTVVWQVKRFAFFSLEDPSDVFV
jgi:hypothetical protein